MLKTSFISTFTLLFATLFSLTAQSQNLQLGTASFSGNACPSGSAAVSISPDGSAISFLFDQFSTSLGTQSSKSKRLNCQISIPIRVASGFLVEATHVDYRGFISMGPQGRLILMSSGLKGVARGGLIGDSAISEIKGSQSQNFSIRQVVLTDISKKRKCSVQKSLIINITAILESGKMKSAEGLETQFTMDTADIGADGVSVGVALIPCS